MSQDLYFIALIPPQSTYDEIKAFQQVMSERFDSHKSFNHIPHITLVPPFRINPSDIDVLKSIIKHESEAMASLKLHLHGFGTFPKHTIFMCVDDNPALAKLHRELLKALNRQEGLLAKPVHYFQQYHPHVTIGYRDLKDTYKQAWEYFEKQQYEAEFVCQKVSLLKHDGAAWEVVDEFPFTLGQHQ